MSDWDQREEYRRLIAGVRSTHLPTAVVKGGRRARFEKFMRTLEQVKTESAFG